MRKRQRIMVLVGLLVIGGLGIAEQVAQAHECTTSTTPADTGGKKPKKNDAGGGGGETVTECHPTAVYPNWRDNYVPLFDLTDRDSEQERRDAQRWRDENGCLNQFCIWAEPSGSVDDTVTVTDPTGGQHEVPGPLTFHGGMAGEHALGEGAHSDEEHTDDEFHNHDSHGGSIYADVCLGTDEGTSYDGQAGDCDGVEDTQVGVTIVDHLTCPGGCMDEYHVVRPLDTAYTTEQMNDSVRDIGEIVEDPMRYVCGYEEQGSSCY